jgi:hypothetical protein
VLVFPIGVRSALMQGTDVWLAFALIATLVFAQRLARHGRKPDALLTGFALGGLAGAKYSGLMIALALVMLALLALAWRCASSASSGRRCPCWRVLSLVPLAALLVAGPYYVRNLVHYANPLWPARIAPLGWLVFDGPFTRADFAAQTLGFDLPLLLARADFFRQGFGWTALLCALAPLCVLAAIVTRRLPWGTGLAWLILPTLLFVCFLRQPYSSPAASYTFTMRFLLGWAVCGLLVAVCALERLGGERVGRFLALVLAILMVATLRQWTQQWWIPTALASLASLLPVLDPRAAPFLRRPWLAPGPLPFAVVLGLIAWPLERFRAHQQYDPEYGYHDSEADRGWGAIARYVHRYVGDARIAFHGSGTFFPLYGDDLSNEPIHAPEAHSAEELLAFCRERSADYLACFVPSQRVPGNGPFEFGQSLAAAILASTDPPELVLREKGAALFRLRQRD